MTPDLFSPEHIISEVRNLKYLYGLKHEIRYGQKRPAGDLTESVAEHIYGIHILAHYFLPLEDPENKLDKLKVFSMITVHDLDEIETGDTIAYRKSKEMYDREESAGQLVLQNSPEILQAQFSDLRTEFTNLSTPEARFVRAVDVFEPLIQIYKEFGREIHKLNKPTAEEIARTKEPNLKNFPVMYRYYKVIYQAMIDEGFFYISS